MPQLDRAPALTTIRGRLTPVYYDSTGVRAVSSPVTEAQARAYRGLLALDVVQGGIAEIFPGTGFEVMRVTGAALGVRMYLGPTGPALLSALAAGAWTCEIGAGTGPERMRTKFGDVFQVDGGENALVPRAVTTYPAEAAAWEAIIAGGAGGQVSLPDSGALAAGDQVLIQHSASGDVTVTADALINGEVGDEFTTPQSSRTYLWTGTEWSITMAFDPILKQITAVGRDVIDSATQGDAQTALGASAAFKALWDDADTAALRMTLGALGNFDHVAIAFGDSPVTCAVNKLYEVDSSGGGVTLNLPALAGLTEGDRIGVFVEVAGNTITVDGDGSEPIDGATTDTMSIQYQLRGYEVNSDKSAWIIF